MLYDRRKKRDFEMDMSQETLFIDQVNRLSDQTVELCYHCHKCTAGCPVVLDMQYGPDRVLRMVQFGEADKLLNSSDIWLCASCETCGTRCPNEIDIARVMDALRQIALQRGVPAAEPNAYKFHRLFLFLLERMGRMHEASLLASYKVWSRNLLSDMDSGAVMFVKGKVPLKPQAIKGRKEIGRIFKEVQAKSPEKREDQG
jgi:heterodisulfide reductase subunit C2